ncbi:hypothetical protein QOT17_018920 [Balamuthia mandrillaris]
MEKERSLKSAFDLVDYWNPSWPRRTLSQSAFAQSYVHRLQLESQSKTMFSAIRYEGGFAYAEENRFVLCQRYAGQLLGLRFVPQHLAKLRWELRTLNLCRGHPSFPQLVEVVEVIVEEEVEHQIYVVLRSLLARHDETIDLECFLQHHRNEGIEESCWEEQMKQLFGRSLVLWTFFITKAWLLLLLLLLPKRDEDRSEWRIELFHVKPFRLSATQVFSTHMKTRNLLFQPIEAYEGKRSSLDLKAVNMYQLGAVLYNMLTLEAPFQSLSPLTLMTNICEVRFDKERRHYARLSSAAKQIVEGQLLRDPTKRWSMTQLLRHAWFGGRNKEKRAAEADRLFELCKERVVRLVMGEEVGWSEEGLQQMVSQDVLEDIFQEVKLRKAEEKWLATLKRC